MTKLTNLTKELTVAPADNDWMHIVDRSDTSEDPAGSSYKTQTQYLFGNLARNGANSDITSLSATTFINMNAGKISFGAGTDVVQTIIEYDSLSFTNPTLKLSPTIAGFASSHGLHWEVSEATPSQGAGFHIESHHAAADSYLTTRAAVYSVSRFIGRLSAGNFSSGTRKVWVEQYDGSTQERKIQSYNNGVLADRFKLNFSTGIPTFSGLNVLNGTVRTDGSGVFSSVYDTWTTVGAVSTEAQYNTIQAAIDAGKDRLKIIGDFTVTGEITMDADLYIFNTDTLRMGDYSLTSTTEKLRMQGGVIYTTITTDNKDMFQTTSGKFRLFDCEYDNSANTGLNAGISKATNKSVHQIDNIRFIPPNAPNWGIKGVKIESAITNISIDGGGSSCSGFIIDAEFTVISQISASVNFSSTEPLLTVNNCIVSNVNLGGANALILASARRNTFSNIIGSNLTIDADSFSEQKFSNCRIDAIDLSDASSDDNSLSNIQLLGATALTIAGDSNKVTNLKTVGDLTITGDNNRLVSFDVGGAFTDSGSGNYYAFSDTGAMTAYSLEVANMPTVGGTSLADTFQNRTPVSVPADETSTGAQGDWSYGGGYLYKCVATDTWVRWAVITSW